MRVVVLCLCCVLLAPRGAQAEDSLDIFRRQQKKKKAEERKKAYTRDKKLSKALFWSGVTTTTVGAMLSVGPFVCMVSLETVALKVQKGVTTCAPPFVFVTPPMPHVQLAIGATVMAVGSALLQASYLVEPIPPGSLGTTRSARGPAFLTVGGVMGLAGLVTLGFGVFRTLQATDFKAPMSALERQFRSDLGKTHTVGGVFLLAGGISYMVTGAMLWRR